MSAIYTVRTTSGREDIVLDMLETRVRADTAVKAVVHPAEIKGYVFVEGELPHVHRIIQGLMHVRGVIEKPVRLEQIQRFLEYKKTRITIDLGDIVEIVGGSFKSEKGKVIRVDKVKGEVTIELLEASIPIPVTIATEFVKVIKRAKPEEYTEKPRPQEKTERAEITVGTRLEEEGEEEKLKEEPEGEEPSISEEEAEETERHAEKEAEQGETLSEPAEKSGESAETDEETAAAQQEAEEEKTLIEEMEEKKAKKKKFDTE